MAAEEVEQADQMASEGQAERNYFFGYQPIAYSSVEVLGYLLNGLDPVVVAAVDAAVAVTIVFLVEPYRKY